MSNWLKKRSCIYWYDQYALNDQDSAFATYDPDRIVDDLVGTGADIVALYAANQFSVAYYPSKIWPQHPKLEGRDYFGDICTRLQASGVKVLAYTNWLESRHPEWNRVPVDKDKEEFQKEMPLASWADPNDPERRVQNVPGGQWRMPCFNSPRRGQVVATAREIAELYRPDAFCMDMFVDESVCACDYCRPALEKICRTKSINEEVIKAHWREYINWRNESTSSLIAEMADVLREHGVASVPNTFVPLFLGPIYGQTEKWLPSLDAFLSECFDAFLNPCSDLNSTSVNVRWQHAVDAPAWIVRTSAQIHYAHQSLTEAQWLVYAAACKANGCHAFGPCGIGAYPDTTFSPKLLKRVKTAFDFYMQDSDLQDNAVSAANVGIVFSWATRNLADMNDVAWCEEFQGWARLLMEEHMPYDVVSAEAVTSADDLSRYELLILPDTRCLSDSFCETLKAYVSNGGRILATAQSSLYTENRDARADFALADVLGVNHQTSIEGLFALERPIEHEPASGVFQQVKGTADTLGRRVEVDPAGSVGGILDPVPTTVTDWPVATINDFGSGKSVYIAFDVGKFFQKYGDEHIGLWMVDILNQALPKRQLVANGPKTVEVTLWRQQEPARTIIHLANRSVAHTLPTDARQFTEILPVHDFEVSLDLPYPRSRVTCRRAEISSRVEGDRLVARIHVLGPYAAIVIEPDDQSEA